MADVRHIENRFGLYLGAILANLCKFRNGDEESHSGISRLTKMAIFANSRWRTTAILKIALSPYLSRELSDVDQIWYAYANFHSEDGYLTKTDFFSNSRWRTDAILKIVFWLYLCAILARNLEQRWMITCRYRSPDQICNFRKFKMADRRHFENSIISISQPRIRPIRFRSNLVGRCRLQFPWRSFNKKSKFCKFKMEIGRASCRERV